VSTAATMTTAIVKASCSKVNKTPLGTATSHSAPDGERAQAGSERDPAGQDTATRSDDEEPDEDDAVPEQSVDGDDRGDQHDTDQGDAPGRPTICRVCALGSGSLGELAVARRRV
jgi:hypothetical protein